MKKVYIDIVQTQMRRQTQTQEQNRENQVWFRHHALSGASKCKEYVSIKSIYLQERVAIAIDLMSFDRDSVVEVDVGKIEKGEERIPQLAEPWLTSNNYGKDKIKDDFHYVSQEITVSRFGHSTSRVWPSTGI